MSNCCTCIRGKLSTYFLFLQNLSEVSSLPGLEDDSVLKEEIDASVKGYRAFRLV